MPLEQLYCHLRSYEYSRISRIFENTHKKEKPQTSRHESSGTRVVEHGGRYRACTLPHSPPPKGGQGGRQTNEHADAARNDFVVTERYLVRARRDKERTLTRVGGQPGNTRENERQKNMGNRLLVQLNASGRGTNKRGLRQKCYQC